MTHLVHVARDLVTWVTWGLLAALLGYGLGWQARGRSIDREVAWRVDRALDAADRTERAARSRQRPPLHLLPPVRQPCKPYDFDYDRTGDSA